jgi:quercetin dioxygenase-like cupin family protein
MNIPPPMFTHQPGQGSFRTINAEDVEWHPFASFPPEVRLAILVGHPSEAGQYIIRVRMPANVRMMPHRHSEDRVYTVISGVFYVGVGKSFDEGRLTAHAPGTLIVLPAGTPHFHWARSGEYVTQISAVGPLGLEYVNPSHDPRSAAHGPI